MERWLSPREVAEYLGCSERSVRRHAAEWGGRKVGGLLRFKASEIDRRLNESRLDGH